MRSPYDPLVILLMPRWSDAVSAVQAGYGVIDRVDHAFALAENPEEARLFQAGWSSTPSLPLLILRVPASDSLSWSVDAVAELSKSKDDRPVGVLLVDGPEVAGYADGKRGAWNRAFAEAVHKAVLDSQVIEYSTTWSVSPPKVR
jgi:hypothetical protein